MRYATLFLIVLLSCIMLNTGANVSQTDTPEEAIIAPTPESGIASSDSIAASVLPVGYMELDEHSSRTYLGNGEWQSVSVLGETNTWNGTAWARYIYNPTAKSVSIGKLAFTHGPFGDISVQHSTSGFLIDAIRWYAQYYFGGMWQNFTFENYQFVDFTKTVDNVTVDQRWWSTQGELNVTYTYNWQHALKMSAKATNWAAATVPVRIIWAALGIEMGGLEFSLLVDNGVTVGVQIGQQQLTWSDVVENAPDIDINPVLDRDNQRAGIVFGNMSNTLATGQTMVIDPEYSVYADEDDNYWLWDEVPNRYDTATYMRGGTTGSPDYWPYYGYFRMSIGIEYKSTITDASLTLYQLTSYTTTSVSVNRIDSANPPAPEGGSQPSLDYAYTSSKTPSAGSNTWTTNIANMVQKHVDLDDYTYGNYIGFGIYGGDDGIQWEEYSHASSNQPYLTVTWTPADPVWITAPSCTNLDDTDNLYAQHKVYVFEMNVSHVVGWEFLYWVDLWSCLTYADDYVLWGLRWTQSSDTFSELGSHQDKTELVSGSCSSSNGTSWAYLTFALYVDWGDTVEDALNQDVKGLAYDDDYSATWSRVDCDYDYYCVLAFGVALWDGAIDDGAGTKTRGPLDGAWVFSTYVTYAWYYTTKTPLDSKIDVWVNQTDYGSNVGPWMNGSSTFTITGYYDDEIGQQIVQAVVVPNGTGITGKYLCTGNWMTYMIADRVHFICTVSSTWTVIGTSINAYNYAHYDWDDTPYTGSATWSDSTNGSVSHSTYGTYVFKVTSFTDTTHGITSFTNDTAAADWDTILPTGTPAYYWVEYTSSFVWLVWGTPTSFEWAVNSSAVPNGIVMQSQMNGTDNAWATTLGGSIAGLCIGSFDSSWYYANISVRAQLMGFDWIIWTQVLEVDILHSLQLVSFNIIPTDFYFWIQFQTNLMNASITIWDDVIDSGTLFSDNIYHSDYEGMHQIPVSTIVGNHHLTICITSTGTEYDRVYTAGDYVWWYNFTHVVEPQASAYEWSYIYTYNQAGDYVDWENFVFYINGTELATNTFYNRTDYSYNIVIKDVFDDVVYNQTAEWEYTWRILLDIHSFKLVSELDGKILMRCTSSGGGYKETWLYWGEVYEWWLYANKDYLFYWNIEEPNMGMSQGPHYYPANNTWYSPGSAAMYVIDAFGMGKIYDKIPDPTGAGGLSDESVERVTQAVMDDLIALLNPLQGGILGVLILAGFIALAYMSYAVPTKVEKRTAPKPRGTSDEGQFQKSEHKPRFIPKKLKSKLRPKSWGGR